MFVIPIRDTEPSSSQPFVTALLIAANVFVFLYELFLDPYSGELFRETYALVPYHFTFTGLVTSMFLHGGWFHILGNMLFLWIFGDNVEDILGHGKYLLFYLLCGIAAGLAQVIIDPFSRIPIVGASGAIAGVMGAYLVKFPHARIHMLFWVILIFTFDLPAWAVLIYWFVLQLFNGVGSIGYSTVNQGGVAFFAHVGGFIAGAILVNMMGARQPYARRRDLYW